jgi:hypothetical protein
MRKVSLLMSHGMRSSLENFLVTSTATSLGHPATARSSFSVTDEEEEEMREEKTINTKDAATSAAVNPT